MYGSPSRNAKHHMEFVYDFDQHGGAQGVIDLGDLPLGAVIQTCDGVVETTVLAPAGAATVILGTADDDNGFIASVAKATLVAQAVVGGPIAAKQPITNDANSRNVQMTIATADLTQGKIRFIIGFWIPSNVEITE